MNFQKKNGYMYVDISDYKEYFFTVIQPLPHITNIQNALTNRVSIQPSHKNRLDRIGLKEVL